LNGRGSRTINSDYGSRLDCDAMNQYWLDLSAHHLADQDDGLAAICYAGMPAWFNRFLDRYQRKAMARLVKSEEVRDARVLDLGTGVGRWARWFVSKGALEVVGIDLEPARLELASSYGGPIKYRQMAAESLDFPDRSFDLVSSVTVLQHVGHATKRDAIAEIGRVLKRGGKAAIFEETHMADDAPHVFPWSRQSWETEFARHGMEVSRIVGDQYTPLLRVLKTGFSLWKRENARAEIEAMKRGAGARNARVIQLLRIAVLVSYPIEELARFLPSDFAKITGFLFIKKC
jgi:ubiquinone/menaquinone biosynthesis C-methylase UbiE